VKFALLLCAVTTVASAQPAPDDKQQPKPADALSKIDTTKIEQLFDEGTKHYDLGEWDKAIASFKQAYALMPDPSFLYNLGQAYKQKGACREAKAAYVAYLRKAPDEDRAKVEGFIHELEPCVKIEEEKARRLLPPRHQPAWPRAVTWSGYTGVGVGLVLGGLGAWFTVKSHRAGRDFEEACADGCTAGPDLDRIERRGHNASRNATIFYVAAGTMAVAGTVAVVLGRRAGERLALAPAPGGVVLIGGVKF